MIAVRKGTNMDVRYINPFIAAVSAVFVTMVGAPVAIGTPYLKRPDESSDVVAFIGITGDIVGSVSFCLPTPTALRIARAFAQTEMPLDDPQFADALGEVVNMIAGQAKSRFEGRECHISLPRVLSGHEIATLDSCRTPVLVLPCDTALGRFRLEITITAARSTNSRNHSWTNECRISDLRYT